MLAHALTPPTAATPPPISVVIPSYARAHNLPTGLCSLLKYEPLRRAGSEVVVAHGSARSLNASASIDAAVDRCAGAGASSARLRHLDLVALNARMYVAERFAAAARAANEVVVHLDDDLLPSEELLAALAARVAADVGGGGGANGTAAAASVYGPTVRQCGAHGYADPGNAATHPVVGGERGGGGGGGGGGGAAVTHAVLTNLAATSRSLCAAFVAAFDERYASLIALTRGNGEDLAFNDFARRAGGAAVRVALPAAVPLGAVAAGVATLDDGRTSGSAFYAKAGHYKLRVRICRCLGAGHGGAALADCVKASEADAICDVGEKCR